MPALISAATAVVLRPTSAAAKPAAKPAAKARVIECAADLIGTP
jgi:hypothetical protein